MNKINLERRGLFSSFLSSNKEGKIGYIRPPYYKDESSFERLCISCNTDCIKACEEGILFLNSDKTPYINFSNGGCTFCDACANICPNNVLNIENKNNIFALFEIDMLKCMSWNSTMCFSCSERCSSKAIEFLGMFKPTINQDLCTSCGFCFSLCPTNAISYTKIVKVEENESSI